jgi:hypothetical protein
MIQQCSLCMELRVAHSVACIVLEAATDELSFALKLHKADASLLVDTRKLLV